MKKIALTSLLAVFAVSGAHAANVIDGNPLYMPRAGHFYSVTNLETHTDYKDGVKTPWSVGEVFGFGILNNWELNVKTTASENNAFDNMSWNEFKIGTTVRAVSSGGWKMDFVGAYEVDPVWGDHRPFLKEEDTNYKWFAGVRAGYTSHRFTLAGKSLFEYRNTESFNWDEKPDKQGVHALVLGLDGQLVIDSHLSLVAGAEYTGILDSKWNGNSNRPVKNAGLIHGEFGVNYNLDSAKFVGLYINGDMNHQGGVNRDKWETVDGFGYGIKFGVDF